MFVKICGITNEDDALLAVALGADALGFVFAPSRRQVNAETVRDIVKRVPREVLTVGVFRNDTPAHVVDVAARTGLHAVQLHGSRAAVRGAVGPRARALRDPGLRRGRSRARGRGEQPRRRDPRRLARSRLGTRLRLAAGRGRAERRSHPARRRPDPAQRRRRDPARSAVGRRRVERRRGRTRAQGSAQAAAVHRSGARGREGASTRPSLDLRRPTIRDDEDPPSTGSCARVDGRSSRPFDWQFDE